MKNFNEFLTSKGITNEEFATKTVQEMAELNAEFNLLNNKAISEVVESKASIEAVTKLENAINELGAKVQANSEIAEKGQVSDSLLKAVTENRSKIDMATRQKGSGSAFEFVVKADTNRASVANNGMAMDLAGIGQLATRKLTVYDLFPKVSVPQNMNGTVRYIDWDEATTVRSATAIAEGTAFPESTAKWATYTLNLQKVGDSVPMSEEFAYDDQMLVQEVRNFLATNVDVKIDTDLINANGTSPNIKGLLAQAGAYTATAQGISDASIYDLLVDVKRTITLTGGSKYNPDFALMNIADINKMLLKKDVNKQYVTAPFALNANGVFTVNGIRVIECNALTANTCIVGDSRFAKIYEEAGMFVGVGYDGSDWSNDMMTLKARKRLNLLVRTADQTGFKKVTSISASLVTLAS